MDARSMQAFKEVKHFKGLRPPLGDCPLPLVKISALDGTLPWR
jgi:hypothetical protein